MLSRGFGRLAIVLTETHCKDLDIFQSQLNAIFNIQDWFFIFNFDYLLHCLGFLFYKNRF